MRRMRQMTNDPKICGSYFAKVCDGNICYDQN